MRKTDLLKKYLSAVKQAIENDNRNLGFYVPGPEHYLADENAEEVDRFMAANVRFQLFYDSVGVYFDAKSHYVDEIDGVSIDIVREKILLQATEIEDAERL
jgi:hypothetical protein